MFATSQADSSLLERLRNELRYRNVPRAIALQRKVETALGGAPNQGGAKDSPPSQQVLELASKATAPAASTAVTTRTIANRPSPASQSLDQEIPTMSFDEALKVLSVNRNSPWDAVEKARRNKVNNAHPTKLGALAEGRRTTLVVEAKRANQALLVLAKARMIGTGVLGSNAGES
jgi:hypothetical protein